MIFDKGAKQCNRANTVFSTNGPRTTGHLDVKNETIHKLYTLHKIKIVHRPMNVNAKCKTIKLEDNNIRENLDGLG